MPFLKQENLATPIQLRFRELCGGFYPYTSVFEQETKVVSYAGVTFSFNSRMMAKKFGMKAPLGKNEIGKFLSTATKNASLHREGKEITNYSFRKTCISRLFDADVPGNFVAQLMGHKSTESLQMNLYKSACAKRQKRMCLTFSRADLSGSRNEALSSVHNQGFEVVTRSNTDIVACSTTNTLIDPSSDLLLSSNAPVFTGANIGSISGFTFQTFHGNVKIVQNERQASNGYRER